LDAFQAAASAAADVGAVALKAGRDVYGMLRPDKIVAYFRNREAMQAAADRLAVELSECPQHGVPFTAELSGCGLLSWGIDPPRREQFLPWQERESWRLWITNRLASALVIANARAASPKNAVQFALERLRLEGVDVGTWTASETVWQGGTRNEAATDGHY
jgi:hypothetical protein